MVSLEVRRARFASFVDRAVTAAQERGWSTEQLHERTGVAVATIYRWRKGEWAKDPRPSQVMSFCAGVGVPVDEAYRALGWRDPSAPAEPPAPLTNPLLLELAARLEDPSVSLEEKGLIEETIRMWVARGATRRARKRQP